MTRRAYLVSALGLAAALALAASACSSGGGGSGSGPEDLLQGTPVDVTIDVSMGDNFFQPSDLSVRAAESFRLDIVNDGNVAHNLRIAGLDNRYETGDDKVSKPRAQKSGEPGALIAHIDEPGVYNFRCDLHPVEMVGRITVGP